MVLRPQIAGAQLPQNHERLRKTNGLPAVYAASCNQL
jgi:hypothetical protein